jgi:hypothetical protein
MHRRSILVLALAGLAPLLAATAAMAGPYEGGRSTLAGFASTQTCATFLGSNLYSCNVIGEGPGAFHDCYQFSPGSTGEQEDMSSPLGLGPVACDCSATGSTTNPKFDASKTAFICDGTSNGGVAVVGKVAASGKKIVKGAIQLGTGSSYVFSCVLDPSCTP